MLVILGRNRKLLVYRGREGGLGERRGMEAHSG